MSKQKFIILVTGGVYGENASFNAYQFTKTALENNHQVVKVFFYQNGVYQSNDLLSPASDEFNLNLAWQALSKKYNLAVINCVSAALRRGILSENDAMDNEKSHWNTTKPFEMGGLGELVTGIETADRLVRF